ncbi:MAG: hypothetical protein HKL82_11040 [Acidimicrobiaceae bacterium]|nr:hypothetical protein [Acidimicrobiaceae bacterium]
MTEAVGYDPRVDWYWLWGQKMYVSMFPEVEAGADLPISWEALHRFVISYAWIDRRFRNVMDKPCWILDPEAVELAVMLFLGRKSYEEHRVAAKAGGVGEHLDFLNLRYRVVLEIGEVLHGCSIEEEPHAGYEHGPKWASHVGENEWVPALLRRVERWEGLKLPRSPEMDGVARPAAKMAAEAVLGRRDRRSLS